MTLTLQITPIFIYTLRPNVRRFRQPHQVLRFTSTRLLRLQTLSPHFHPLV